MDQRPMSTFLHLYYRLLQVLLTLLMAVLIIPVSMQILSRYTGLIPRYIWTEEIARFCFMWIIMLGAMIAVRDDSHFDVDVLPHMGPRGEALSRLFVHLAMLLVALAFIWYGWDFAILGTRKLSEIFGLPMLWIYGAWPVAGITWVLFLGEKMVHDFRCLRHPENNP